MVMLKVPNPLLFGDLQIYQRFQRETEIARRLDDPGVQRSLDLHDNANEPYLVLEYIEGKNLRLRMQEFKERVPIPVAIDWGDNWRGRSATCTPAGSPMATSSRKTYW